MVKYLQKKSFFFFFVKLICFNFRLNISPSSSRASSPQSPRRSTPVRGQKRRRILTDSEKTSLGTQVSSKSTGDISITDQDIGGKFVKIHNKGKQVCDFIQYMI